MIDIEKQAEEYAVEKLGEQEHQVFKEGVASYIAWKTAEVEQAFQDGAKWGTEHAIEWHDLREDPNDLPKESGYYWCRTEYNDIFLKHQPCLFTKTDGIFNIDVIAWCELPQFKE